MAYKVYMDDSGILRLTIIGSFSKEDVETYFKEITIFKNRMQDRPFCMLVDARQLEKVDAAARKIMIDFLKDSNFSHVAVLGESRYVRLLVRLVNKVLDKKEVRFYDAGSDLALSEGPLSEGPLSEGPLSEGPLSEGPLSEGGGLGSANAPVAEALAWLKARD